LLGAVDDGANGRSNGFLGLACGLWRKDLAAAVACLVKGDARLWILGRFFRHHRAAAEETVATGYKVARIILAGGAVV
jgi:hypothetical protein